MGGEEARIYRRFGYLLWSLEGWKEAVGREEEEEGRFVLFISFPLSSVGLSASECDDISPFITVATTALLDNLAADADTFASFDDFDRVASSPNRHSPLATNV